MITFVLCDKTKSLVENGLTVRFFKSNIEHLPVIQGLDDIVVIRDIKVFIPDTHSLYILPSYYLLDN